MAARGLELKVPPVALLLIAAGLMGAAGWGVPTFKVRLPGRMAVAAGVALAGVIVCLLGVGSFKRAKTTVNPMRPESASALVVGGVYRLTRNPMYLGFLLLLLGWAAFLSNGLALLPVAMFVVYLDRFQIRPEERALDSLFGEEYAAYKKRVRRWF